MKFVKKKKHPLVLVCRELVILHMVRLRLLRKMMELHMAHSSHNHDQTWDFEYMGFGQPEIIDFGDGLGGLGGQ